MTTDAPMLPISLEYEYADYLIARDVRFYNYESHRDEGEEGILDLVISAARPRVPSSDGVGNHIRFMFELFFDDMEDAYPASEEEGYVVMKWNTPDKDYDEFYELPSCFTGVYS